MYAHALTLSGPVCAAGEDQMRELVLRALSEAWICPRDLIGVCIDLIKRNSVVSEAIARANAAWPKRLTAAELCGAPGIAALASDPLLCCLLECAPVTDIGLERVLKTCAISCCGAPQMARLLRVWSASLAR